ncbi:MAG: RnfH family protein [Betaproteobacteria bacterium]|nr:RnfH family protein [Betaproteobacteria bacterium]
MRVEVVYALADVQDIVVLELAEGAVARDAVAASGVLARHGLNVGKLMLGIAGRRVAPEHRLRESDRVEILRPLAADPNEARRQRARRGR